MSTTKKKRTRKSAPSPTSWPFKKGPQSVAGLIDYDYLDQLSPEELKWLEDFTRAEYLNDTHLLRRLKNGKKPTKGETRAIYNANNARRRDAALRSNYGQTAPQKSAAPSPEDILLALEALHQKDPDQE